LIERGLEIVGTSSRFKRNRETDHEQTIK